MAVTRSGIPVRAWCWPGNTGDSALIRQVKDELRDWTLSRVVWVADRGFASAENRRFLRRGAHHYIIGERLRSGSVRIPPKANTLSAPSRTPVPLKPNTIGAKRRVCSGDAYVLFGFRSTRGRLTAFSCAMILLSDLSSLPCEGAGPAVRQRCSDRRPGGAIWRPAAGLRRSSSAAQRGRRRRP